LPRCVDNLGSLGLWAGRGLGWSSKARAWARSK